MPYKHVLCSVDLSEESAQVLDKARDAAQNNGAKLSLLTIVKPLTQVYGGLDMAPVASGAISFEEEALKQAAAQLQDLGAKYGVAAEDTHVVLGAPAHEIRESSKDFAADLIVMGTHGRGAVERMWVGSVTHGVVQRAACPVISVRQPRH